MDHPEESMNRMSHALAVGGATLLLCFSATQPAHSASNGINALVAVAQLKANQANEEALDAAGKQRAAVKAAKDPGNRARLQQLVTLNEKHAKNYAKLSAQLKEIRARLEKSNCK